MIGPDDPIEVKQSKLFPTEFGVSIAMNDEMIRDIPSAKLDTIFDSIRDQLIIELRARIYSYGHYQCHIEYPSDWWQAFKLRWFPAWALRRWPPQLTEHHIYVREWAPKMIARKYDSYLTVIDMNTPGFEDADGSS